MNLHCFYGEEHSRTPVKGTVNQQYSGRNMSKFISWMF